MRAAPPVGQNGEDRAGQGWERGAGDGDEGQFGIRGLEGLAVEV
ncbi:hypothetical protein [Streptomyces sp. AS02]|nr:hypothetical protein [Streptomyces sp. AS02]